MLLKGEKPIFLCSMDIPPLNRVSGVIAKTSKPMSAADNMHKSVFMSGWKTQKKMRREEEKKSEGDSCQLFFKSKNSASWPVDHWWNNQVAVFN